MTYFIVESLKNLACVVLILAIVAIVILTTQDMTIHHSGMYFAGTFNGHFYDVEFKNPFN